MKTQTLAGMFEGQALTGAGQAVFGDDIIASTNDAAKADSVDDTRRFVDSLLTNARDQLLDLSLVDVLLGGWLKLRAIQAYATGDQLASDKTHKHSIGQHKVSSKHTPKIELFVHDAKIAEVSVDIDLALVVANANLMIHKGRITGIGLSGCKATATVSCRGHELLQREAAELDFPATLELGKGIVIPPPLNLKDFITNAVS